MRNLFLLFSFHIKNSLNQLFLIHTHSFFHIRQTLFLSLIKMSELQAKIQCCLLGIGQLFPWNTILTISDYYYEIFPVSQSFRFCKNKDASSYFLFLFCATYLVPFCKIPSFFTNFCKIFNPFSSCR